MRAMMKTIAILMIVPLRVVNNHQGVTKRYGARTYSQPHQSASRIGNCPDRVCSHLRHNSD